MSTVWEFTALAISLNASPIFLRALSPSPSSMKICSLSLSLSLSLFAPREIGLTQADLETENGKPPSELHAEEKRFGSFGCVGFCNLVSNCDYSAPV